jgi:hypothetical protein
LPSLHLLAYTKSAVVTVLFCLVTRRFANLQHKYSIRKKPALQEEIYFFVKKRKYMFHFWGRLGIIEPIGNGFLQATVEALGRYGFA